MYFIAICSVLHVEFKLSVQAKNTTAPLKKGKVHLNKNITNHTMLQRMYYKVCASGGYTYNSTS